MTHILSWRIGDLRYVVGKYLATFSPAVTWNTSLVPIKSAVLGEMAGNPDFFGVCWLYLVIFSKNVLIEKYEHKLDLISQKAKMERNRALLRELFSAPACNLNWIRIP